MTAILSVEYVGTSNFNAVPCNSQLRTSFPTVAMFALCASLDPGSYSITLSSVYPYSNSNSNLLKQHRARRAFYRLLKHTVGIKPTNITCIHCSQNKIKNKKTLRSHEHYIKFTVQKLTKLTDEQSKRY